MLYEVITKAIGVAVDVLHQAQSLVGIKPFERNFIRSVQLAYAQYNGKSQPDKHGFHTP